MIPNGLLIAIFPGRYYLKTIRFIAGRRTDLVAAELPGDRTCHLVRPGESPGLALAWRHVVEQAVGRFAEAVGPFADEPSLVDGQASDARLIELVRLAIVHLHLD